MGPAHEHGGVLSDLAPTPDPSSSFLEFHMVFAQSAVLPSAVPAVSAPPGCACPTCCTPPTATPTMCSAGRYDHLLPAGGLPDRRALVHPPARRRRTRRLADQLGPGPLHRTARPRRLAGRADRGVRRAATKPLGRRGVASPTARRRRPGRIPAGLGARRRVGARTDVGSVTAGPSPATRLRR